LRSGKRQNQGCEVRFGESALRGNSTWTAFKEIEHGILADQWNGLWASDHLPVLAETEIK
jgi:hypothetical protein